MTRLPLICSSFALYCLTTVCLAQGGFQGQTQQSGAFGGGQGGFGGARMQYNAQRANDARSIDQAISTYLDTPELKSVLTPGEYGEWILKLKAGEVVIADARSDSFDPALEVVDSKRKVLAANDDRYPGDQRPLLLWRCEVEGTYALHVRGYHDKFGGQVFVRLRTYESVHLGADPKAVANVTARGRILLMIPMKAGQIKQIRSDPRGIGLRGIQTIAPDGLPDLNLGQRLQPLTNDTTIIAPVDGNYYLLCDVFTSENSYKLNVWAQDVVPKSFTGNSNSLLGTANVNETSVWQLAVKTGDLLEVSAPELNVGSTLLVTDVPDLSNFDLSDLEKNPFFPKGADYQEPPSAFTELPARARDSRYLVIYINRDAKLWVGSNGWSFKSRDYGVSVKPAARNFRDDLTNSSSLKIGFTDYWQFDAKAGDVMTLHTSASGFSPVVVVRNPEMAQIRQTQAGVDQAQDEWKMVVDRPGRYVVAMSCMGDGGSGPYSLNRSVLHAREFGLGSPAIGEIKRGQINIWKFTATPNEPLYIHWSSSNWSYDINVYDDKGRFMDFQRVAIDGQNRVGILKVDQPLTYLIVLTGTGDSSKYSIDLNPLPGSKKQK